MVKDFYVFRHGETDMNKQRRRQGQGVDVYLNDEGIKQAFLLAEKMKEINPQIIYSSPLKRAKQTSDIVASVLSVPVLTEDEWKEGCFGIAEGKTGDEFKALHPEAYAKWFSQDEEHRNFGFEGGEGKQEIGLRAVSAIRKLTNTNYDKIAIGTHAGLIRYLLLELLEHRLERITNTQVFHIRYDNGSWKLMD